MWCGYKTGWDLGPFAEALATGQMLPHFKYLNKIQINKGQKNSCAYAQDTKRPKNPQNKKTQLPLSKSQEQKHGVEGKTRGLSIHPALNTSKGWAKHPSHASDPTPGPILILTTDKEPAHSSPSGSCKGICSLFSLPAV